MYVCSDACMLCSVCSSSVHVVHVCHVHVHMYVCTSYIHVTGSTRSSDSDSGKILDSRLLRSRVTYMCTRYRY